MQQQMVGTCQLFYVIAVLFKLVQALDKFVRLSTTVTTECLSTKTKHLIIATR